MRHNRLVRNLWLILLLGAMAAPAYSQLFSLGVKGGVQITNDTSLDDSAYTRRYIVGPTAEIHLPFHLAFEVDALYRRSGFEQDTFDAFDSTVYQVRTRANDWQFPFLAKWEPGSRVLRPFVDGGITYRHIAGSSIDTAYGGQNSVTHLPILALNPNSAGATVGAGLTLKVTWLRLSPEIRYTYWPTLAFPSGISSTNHNQVDFLLGFTF